MTVTQGVTLFRPVVYQQVRVKGMVVNARTMLEGMAIFLMDLNANIVVAHTSVVRVHKIVLYFCDSYPCIGNGHDNYNII